ncbi:MAG: hypothetical protein J7L45_00405, partial [Candidatus Aenigmarchaeota archaeon]|nr:hypothetical protein [Candidatus Aenigmarchaeota archaeon]
QTIIPADKFVVYLNDTIVSATNDSPYVAPGEILNLTLSRNTNGYIVTVTGPFEESDELSIPLSTTTTSTTTTIPATTTTVVTSSTTTTSTITSTTTTIVPCPSSPPSYPTNKWDRVWCDSSFNQKLSDTPDESNKEFDNDWGYGVVGGIQSNYIGFRSGRKIYISTPGDYQFSVGSDDGVRVWIDGNLELNKWVGRPYTVDTFTKYLSSGWHTFRIDYFENRGRARVSFSYTLLSSSTTTTSSSTTSTTPTTSSTTTTVNNLIIIREWNTYGDDNNPFSPYNVYSPYGVCIDNLGYVYVSDDVSPNHGYIYKFDPVTNSLVRRISYPYGHVRGLAWLGGLWVNNGTHVTKIDENGNIISSIHPSWNPWSSLGTMEGDLLIPDMDNEQVRKVRTDGTVVANYSINVTPDYHDRADGLDYGDGYIWTVDYQKGKIYKIDLDGNLIDSWDTRGDSPNGLCYKDDYLWNTDWSIYKVWKLSPT